MHKYANYIYNGKFFNNLGDHIQILTIDNLYKNMGISKDEIVYIDMEDLSSYNGVKVRLPVAFPLLRYSENGIAGMFSEQIEPVFIALTVAKWFLEPEEVAYLKKYQPIGCRDEHTYCLLKKYDIDAYINGCLTITLPQRKKTANQNKIYCIDISEKLKSRLPQEIRDNAVFLSNTIKGHLDDATNFAKKRYQEYQDNAELIITSLLHISAPCTAQGIPVILARDLVSYRFGWLDKILPIYSADEYEAINWKPQFVDIDRIRNDVTELFVRRMCGMQFAALKNKINKYYLDRKKGKYVNEHFMKVKAFIDEHFLDKDTPVRYSIWGITQIAEMIKKYMDVHYKNSELINVYDKMLGKTFKGLAAKSISKSTKDEYVFVTSLGAMLQADQMNVDKTKFIYVY